MRYSGQSYIIRSLRYVHVKFKTFFYGNLSVLKNNSTNLFDSNFSAMYLFFRYYKYSSINRYQKKTSLINVDIFVPKDMMNVFTYTKEGQVYLKNLIMINDISFVRLII